MRRARQAMVEEGPRTPPSRDALFLAAHRFNEDAHAPVPTRRHARRDTAAQPDARPRAATSGPGRSHAGAHPARPEQSGPDPGNRGPDDARGAGARAGGAGSARGDRRTGWADSVRLELRFWGVPHAHARRPGAAGGKIWFTAEGAKVIGRYDPEARVVDWVLGTGQERTHMLVVFEDGKRVVTRNVNSATVTVIEARTVTPPGSGVPRVEWLETVIPVDRGPEGIDVSPDGHDAWVANAQDGTISLIDLEHKRLRGILSADVKGANRLKFTPDGKLVFVSTLSGPEVTVLRSLTGSVVKRVPVGHGAAGIVIQPDGARAYVACTPDDSVAVIDVRSLTVVGRIGAGGRPD